MSCTNLELNRVAVKRHRRGQRGFSVVADDNTTTGGMEAGFYTERTEADRRRSVLQSEPQRWIGGRIGLVVIIDTSSLKILCTERVLCPDDSIRSCVLPAGHDGFHDGGVK